MDFRCDDVDNDDYYYNQIMIRTLNNADNIISFGFGLKDLEAENTGTTVGIVQQMLEYTLSSTKQFSGFSTGCLSSTGRMATTNLR